MKSLYFILIILFAFTVMAEPSPVPSALPDVVIEAPAVLSLLDKVEKAIPVDVAGWLLLAIGFGTELLVRLIPSAKPRSVLLLASSVLSKIASIFSKSSSLLDKVVQNVKEDKKVG